jgi:hypothetical protein
MYDAFNCMPNLPNLTRSQFLEGLKCESKLKDNERIRGRGTLLGLQHFVRVKGVLELRDGTRKN